MSEVGTTGWTFPDDFQTDGWIQPVDNDKVFAGYYWVSQSITNQTWTVLDINTERWDPSGIHDNVTNKDRIYFPEDGYYEVDAQFNSQNGVTNYRVTACEVWYTAPPAAAILADKGNNHVSSQWPVGFYQTLVLSGIFYATEDDYIQLKYYQRNTASAARTVHAQVNMTRMSGKAFSGEP